MKKIQIIPLGGLGEVGKNMTAVQYGDEIYVVDAGAAFPDEDMLGVDVVIPDFDFLRKNKDKLKMVIITHAHEDHIGGLPHFIKEFHVPVFATKLTAAIIGNKLKNSKKQINIINENSRLKGKECEISFFATNHSIPDSVGVVIETPLGAIVHTGDFKIDYTPIDGKKIDFQRLAAIGGKGVLAMLSDSTNAEKKGVSMSESMVKEKLEDAVRKCAGRVIIATFASSLHRVPSIFQIARNLNRKVIILGRTMENNVKIALKLGYISESFEELIIQPKEMKNYLPNQLIVITTGAQGEGNAGLSRMANGEHKDIEIGRGDTVVFSSSTIPGNEKSVGLLINTLLKKHVGLVADKEIHTSGHAYQEEQKLMLSIFRPKYFIPVHGEYRMLIKHADLAVETGVEEENIFICENGDIVEIDEEGARIGGKTKAEAILVDDSGMGDVDFGVLKDRKRLATHGVAIVQANQMPGKKPNLKLNVVLKGIVAKYDKVALNRDLAAVIGIRMEKSENFGAMKKELYEEIGNVIYQHVKRKPMIVFFINGPRKEGK